MGEAKHFVLRKNSQKKTILENESPVSTNNGYFVLFRPLLLNISGRFFSSAFPLHYRHRLRHFSFSFCFAAAKYATHS